MQGGVVIFHWLVIAVLVLFALWLLKGIVGR